VLFVLKEVPTSKYDSAASMLSSARPAPLGSATKQSPGVGVGFNMHRAGLYAIIHVLSGRRYVGQTNSFERRWEQHREALNDGTHHNPRLQALWNADGHLAFAFIEIEVAPAFLQPAELQQWLLRKERDLIRAYKAKGLVFNVVDPELVETRAAAEAATAPRISAASQIHRELQRVKARIAEAEASVRTLTKALEEARLRFRIVEVMQSQSRGLLRGLFGRRDRAEDLAIAAEVEAARATFDKATEDLAACNTELQTLVERRRVFHNSYPGNVRRAAVRRRAWSMF
jgi:hypothetical protein